MSGKGETLCKYTHTGFGRYRQKCEYIHRDKICEDHLVKDTQKIVRHFQKKDILYLRKVMH